MDNERDLLCDKIESSIDVNNVSSIVKFGSSVQKRMSKIQDKMIRSMGGSDMSIIESSITSLLKDIDSFEKEERKGGFLIGKAKAKRKTREYFKDVVADIDATTSLLEAYRIQLLSDLQLTEELSKVIDEAIDELELYISAGGNKLIEKKEELAELREKEQSVEIQHKIQNMSFGIDYLEKRVYDLDVTKVSMMQFSAQLLILKSNFVSMSDQIRQTTVIVIPFWKSRVSIMMGMQSLAEAGTIHSDFLGKAGKMMDDIELDIDDIQKKSGDGNADSVALLNSRLTQAIEKTIEINRKVKEDRNKADKEFEYVINHVKGL